MNADDFAGALAAGGRIAAPVAIVVAHPDDETLWAGALLRRLDDARLIHLTDGAPVDMADATRLGFTTRADYAAARRAELDRVLDLLGSRARRIDYGIVDQGCADDLAALARRLARDCADLAAVITHPYEGGHPDHDSAAWAVAVACSRLGAAAPASLEFACYHRAWNSRQMGVFWSDPAAPEHSRALDAEDVARTDAALAAFVTQCSVIGDWRPRHEHWRAAPKYDFTAPPPPGGSLYDGFGWALTSSRWRARAQAAADGLPC